MFTVEGRKRFGSGRVRAVALAVALLGSGLIGFGAPTVASAAMQADQNYLPNGCKAGQATYLSFTRGRQPCNQWPAWVRQFGGGAARPAASSGIRMEADQNYMPNGCKAGQATYLSFTNGRQPCAKWPAYVRRFGGGGGAPAAAPPSAPASSRGAAIISAARSQIGVPYSWGGGNANGPTRGIGSGAGTVGYDCSGLTMYAYARAGISIPKGSANQHATMRRIPISQLQPGDLVWRPGHIAIFIGNGRIIEAPRPGLRVQETAMRSEFVTGLRK